MARLIKKIKRDIKKSPAKAVVLAGLVVLAVAIWGSKLVATPRTVVQASTAPDGAHVLPTTIPTVTPELGNTQPTTVQDEIDLRAWHVIRTWREQSLDEDETLPPLDRDPFVMNEVIASQSSGETLTKAPNLPISPEDLGLRFTGVVISGHYRAAILENRTVNEGAEIRIERDGVVYCVQITQVDTTRVKFTIDGVEHEQSLRDFGLESVPESNL
jgi:hypothetical protein